MSSPKKILITGASGFVGNFMAERFYALGYKVFGIDINPARNPLFNNDNYRKLDLIKEGLDKKLIKWEPDYILHLAGPGQVGPSFDNPGHDFKNSTLAFHNVLESIRRSVTFTKLILFSSAAVYGDSASIPILESQVPAPISPYGFHKLICEQLAIEYISLYGYQIAIVRPFSIYGNGMKKQVFWDICQKSLQEGSSNIRLFGSGKEKRGFIHIEDVAQSVELIMEKGQFDGKLYNLASGNSILIRSAAKELLRYLKSNKEIIFNIANPKGNPINLFADNTRIKNLGFSQKISLSQGLRDYTNWFLRLK